MTQLASRIRRILGNSRLLPVAFVAWRTARDWTPRLERSNRKARRSSAVPIPPGRLILSSTGTIDVGWFLHSGELTVGILQSALDDLRRPIESFRSVLDLGCGCGRVLRQWAQVKGPRFSGTDYNPAGIEWASANLKGLTLKTNELLPPLPFGDGEFDLVYAISVFTHLPEELQRPWIEELHRVIGPGGVLLLTLSGEGDFERITDEERERFAKGELVVVDAQYAGTNMCGIYHPPSYPETHWGDLFRLKRRYPEGARGSPRQDLYVFERL